MKENERFTECGWLNTGLILEQPENEIYIISSRGIGKTYGILKDCYLQGKKVLHVRRLLTQCEIICKPELSEWRKINENLGINIGPKPVVRNVWGYYPLNEDMKIAGDCIGYLTSMATSGNITGFYMQDVDVLFYDEFIPKMGESPIKNEAELLDNLVETVQRNRELEGGKALKVICAGNANRMQSDILVRKGLIRPLVDMRKRKQHIWTDGRRMILDIDDSPITSAKKLTDLYQRNEGTRFSDIAIDNKFVDSYNDDIKSQPLKEYKPLCVMSDICIYKHKSKPYYYITTHISGTTRVYKDTEIERVRWARENPDLWRAYLHRRIIFEEPLAEILFCKYAGK